MQMKLFLNIFDGKIAVAKFILITVFAISGQATIFAQNAITISTEKMNTLFVGVTNHMSITVEGIPDEQVYLASDEVEITKMGKGMFDVTASNPGRVTLTVHGDGAFQYKNYQFDVQGLPDPMAVLHLENGQVKMDGEMTAEQFKTAIGLGFQLPGNALEITSFNMVRVPRRGDPVEVFNDAAEFNKRTKQLIDEATSGDRFYFQTVSAKDSRQESRTMNSLVFRIK